MSTKLFIGRLSYSVTDAQLEEHFAQAGKVLSAKVIIDKYSGQGKGFGFVEMATEEEAKKAIDQLNNSTLDGRTIVVNEARPQEDRSKRPQGGSGGSNRW
ncbi:MAG: RNA-binding protein [Candidatus Levybacteria bacterium]|nr:RNA-binding protein [Candidatus Levybacteria bacterium]